MNVKKAITAAAAICLLATTTAWAAEPITSKPNATAKPIVKPAPAKQQTKSGVEEQQVIKNAVLDAKAKQALETVKTFMPDTKGWTHQSITKYKAPSRSFYNVEITKSKDTTYPRAGVSIMETTGEVWAFFLQKDRPSFPEAFGMNNSPSPEKEKAKKSATVASNALLAKLLGQKAANYVVQDVAFTSYGNRYTIVATIIYRAKVQAPNTPPDLITIHIDASGKPAMFLHHQ